MSIIERERVTEAVTTRDVLHRAADLLEEFGWCQGHEAIRASGDPCDLRDFGGAVAYCMGGAIRRARTELTNAAWHHNPYEWARQVMPDASLPDWNDCPDRTAAEVVARLREAAEASA